MTVTDELTTLRDFVWCQNPELADTLQYVSQSKLQLAEERAASAADKPQLPSVQGTAVVKSYEATQQGRDDDSGVGGEKGEKIGRRSHKKHHDRHSSSNRKGKKNKSKKYQSGSRRTSSSARQEIVLKDEDEVSLVKRMIKKYDKAAARAAPNVELQKVFENEEFVTFRKVPVHPTSEDEDGCNHTFGGYDETEVRIEQLSLDSDDSSLDSNVSGSQGHQRSARVPGQVMVVISKKTLS